MKTLYWTFTLLVGALAVWMTVEYFSTEPEPIDELEVLESDLFDKVYFVHDSGTGKVKLSLTFPSGEAHNRYASGMAHYVEHLAWMNAFTEFAGVENRANHSNATTTRFATTYWYNGTPHGVRQSLDQLLRVAEPFEVDDATALEERDIVLREYEYRVGDKPVYPVLVELDDVLFDHGPLSQRVIGTPEEIASYSLEDAKRLHSETHRLSDATLLIYGDIPRQRAASLVSAVGRAYSSRPAFVKRQVFPRDLPAIKDSADVYSPDVADDVIVYKQLARLPECGSIVRCDLIIWLAAWLLDSPMEGGVAGPLRFDNFYARDFVLNFDMLGNTHVVLNFRANPDRGADLSDIERVLEETLRATFQGGVPQESFDRAKRQVTEYIETVDYLEDYAAEQVSLLMDRGTDVYSRTEELDALVSIEREDLIAFLTQFADNSRIVSRRVYSTN